MKKTILFLLLFFCIFPITHAKNEGFFATDLTIKELSENIEKLKQEKEVFQEKNKELSKEYGELISFLRNDLTDVEIIEIKQQVENFIEERNTLQKKLKEKIDTLQDTTQEKKDIILQRANFYKYLAKYVETSKRQDFIAHIKFQVQSEKESKDLIEEILKNQNILEQKVTYIKAKIENHKENLQAKIEVSITSKIKERINEIDNDPKYKKIEQKIKNKIYNDFIEQIKGRIKELENSNLSDNYKEMRKTILTKMIEEIQQKIKGQR